ncbi:hypothetical protein PTI98_009543 [Pleurotus ostreatus]|nr:hypothetical protein PTI98_009543 [Pleurotus ostreatus]
MPPLPVEIIEFVFALLLDHQSLYTLLFVSHQFHAIAEPLLYADVSFELDSHPPSHFLSDDFLLAAGMCFLRTITALTNGRCGRHVQRLDLPAIAFMEHAYESCFRSILQHLPNLRHLRVESAEDLHGFLNFSPIPASLLRLSWFAEQEFLSPELFTQFIDDQPFLEHLHTPWVFKPLTLIRQSSLEHLRVLHVYITIAPSILFGRHITHLKIEGSAAANDAAWEALDTGALKNIVVLVARNVRVEYLSSSVLSRMPTLERLELDSPLLYYVGPDVSSNVNMLLT